MLLIPKDLLDKVEFDKIITLVSQECYGQQGAKAIRELPIETDLPTIDRNLEQVAEYKRSLEQRDLFPLHAYESIDEDVRMLRVVDFVLSEESLQRIGNQLYLVRDLYQFFTDERKEVYAHLYDILRPYHFEPLLLEEIERVIDENGEIRPDASPQLLAIRRLIGSKKRELDKEFGKMVAAYRKRGWLTDNVESFRNGRRVLSVPSEHKRKIRGIIHDESASGKTAFIEPEAVIDINNDIFDLYNEEKREIYRILKELSAMLRPFSDQILQFQELIVQFDTIHARARLALRMRGIKPRLKVQPHLGIQMGYHPLLYLKNKELGRETVPFDLTLFGPNRILVLSGPNAGGKSITMKAVGLLQLMVQAGMLVPMDEISEVGIFKKVFADIGDQQSLEDDLSTYSSRLENMRRFLEESDDHTLLLIDEFGSGTDPKMGGGIAEAILDELNRKQVYGLITTHYSNLKIYAFKTKGIVNGSMMFDNEKLSPTYQLKVGRPGSSYAFEIAEKSGLPKKVLKYAKHRGGGKNEKAVDQLLIDLQREKKELEEKLEGISTREKQLEKLISNYEQLHRNLEYQRKKFKLEQKEQSLQQVARDNRELENLVREIREQQNLEKAKAKAKRVKAEREQLSQEIEGLRDDIYQQPKKKQTSQKEQGPIQVGDYVKMKSGGATGQVEEIMKNTALVQMGMMRMTVKLKDLQRAKAPLEVNAAKSVQTDTISQTAQFESKMDIRGMRMEDALRVVEEFVDRALISNANMLKIVHGKGNGILRKAVRKKLREYDAVMNIRHPEEEFGGDGVTLVELE
jgi:DNA mismatch repair protein MutS2